MTIVRQIRRFVAETFHPPGTLTDDTSLTDSATVDSTGLLALCAFLDRRFGVRVVRPEEVPEHLDSITRLAAYVEGKLQDRRSAA